MNKNIIISDEEFRKRLEESYDRGFHKAMVSVAEEYRKRLEDKYDRGFTAAMDSVINAIDMQLGPIQKILDNVSPGYVFKVTGPDHFNSMMMILRNIRIHVSLLKDAIK